MEEILDKVKQDSCYKNSKNIKIIIKIAWDMDFIFLIQMESKKL